MILYIMVNIHQTILLDRSQSCNNSSLMDLHLLILVETYRRDFQPSNNFRTKKGLSIQFYV